MNARVSAARCTVVWTAVSAVGATVVGAVVPAAPAVASSRFDEALVGACAVTGAGCAVWLWLVATALVVGALRGRAPGPLGRGVPEPVRRAVLAACGLALAGAVATPAAASTSLDGLPLPDRPDGSVRPPAAETARTVTVRPGDSLWALAAADLPAGAGSVDVARHWRRIHELNRARVGPDPDLLRTGLQLRLPRPRPLQEQR